MASSTPVVVISSRLLARSHKREPLMAVNLATL
jgi:hypothetical protein